MTGGKVCHSEAAAVLTVLVHPLVWFRVSFLDSRHMGSAKWKDVIATVFGEYANLIQFGGLNDDGVSEEGF